MSMAWARLASDGVLDPALVAALDAEPERRADALRDLSSTPRERSARVRAIPILREDAAMELAALVQGASGDERRAGAGGTPSTHTTGERVRVALSDGSAGEGAREWCRWFVTRVVTALATALFEATPVIHAHGYALRYRRLAERGPNDPTALKFHSDDADYTFNLNLGVRWTGGDVAFLDDDDDRPPGTPKADAEESRGRLWRYSHQLGHGLLHDDCYHAAEPLLSGERIQLIFWLLRDDADWKRDFFPDLERRLATF